MGKFGRLILLLVGLSACHAGAGIDDIRQPISIATDATESATAQAAIGTAWLQSE
jgi:hypothetical protein